MTNEMTFSKAGLPTPQALVHALRSLELDIGLGGVAIIKMDKTGAWVLGAEQTEIEADSLWAVNPFSFMHGYIAWGDGEVLGEVMASVSQPLPEVEAAPEGAKKGWEAQRGMLMKCMGGEHRGLEARYTVTSVGGRRAIQMLASDIAEQVEKDYSKPVPVVKLGRTRYQHKSYGRIYTPEFALEKWVGLDEPDSDPIEGDERPQLSGTHDPETGGEPTEPPRRRRRR